MKKILQKALPLVMVILVLDTNAQVKVGSNPTSLSSKANLQVEATNGTQIIVTKDSGKVGIGTINPRWDLDMFNGNSVSLLRTKGAGDNINYAVHSLEASTGQYWNMLHRQNWANNKHQFTIEYSPDDASWFPYLSIDTAGKVGLGTETPLAKLHIVKGSAGISSNTTLNPNQVALFENTAGRNTALQIVSSAGNQSNLWFNAPKFLASNTYRGGVSYTNLTDSNGTLDLFTSGLSRLFISETGKVGLGTQNPRWDLDMNNNNTVSLLRTKGAGDNINYAVHSLEASTGQYWNMLHRQNWANNKHQFTIEYSPNDSIWYPYFTIDTAGKIGLGTETPETKLEIKVDPNAPRETFQVGGTGYAYAQVNSTSYACFALKHLANSGNQQYNIAVDGQKRFKIDDINDNGYSRLIIEPVTGNVGIGLGSANEKLVVNGAVKIGNTANVNPTAGTIRWNNALQIHDGTSWHNIATSKLPIYANNASAINGGLTVGTFYHTGDGIVRVVY